MRRLPPVSRPLLLLTLLAPLALTVSPNASANAYKCRLPDGSVEIVSRPCTSGSATLSVQNEEKIPEGRRREAEEEVRRLRTQIERREAAQREAPGRDPQAASQPQTGSAAPGNESMPPAQPKRSVEDCLKELDRHALDPRQRLNLESACRSNPDTQLVFVPVPVYTQQPGTLSLPGTARPIIQVVPSPPPAPLPSPIAPVKPGTKPQPAPPQETPSSVCLPGSKFCR